MGTKIFEVEIRIKIDNLNELSDVLPFLYPPFGDKQQWYTSIFGVELFRSDHLLRVTKLFVDGKERYFLGWKGPDLGQFANIREEHQEEVTDGINDSQIMTKLGIIKTRYDSLDEVISTLAKSGYHKFMGFSGENFVRFYEPLGVHIKIMSCNSLKFPLLVEIEQDVETRLQAFDAESNLRHIAEKYSLCHRLIKDEPPSLLYAQLT